ncbi:PhzF family phenazine biosynthesis protein [Chitinophaga sp.]|uniref:PhzF family phenazine biosynthesis protein n=1 Tax=Chitinophaga sp. TaxID=1869181 RepID=UPI0031D91608
MKYACYQIDCFTDEIFKGNPACVVPLEEWLPDEILMKIAEEMALPETAFFIHKNNEYHLRWFTPEIEMDLCGHATLATAYVLMNHLQSAHQLTFKTVSGEVAVAFNNGLYYLDFPTRKPVPTTLPEQIARGLSKQPIAVLKARDYVLVYENESDIRNITLNRQVIDEINLDPGGIVLTSRGETYDFVSRFFTPQASIFEDPVTGSAHCSLIPYWQEQLSKTDMMAAQLSKRGGILHCMYKGDRVLIGGNARTFSTGTFTCG